MPANRPTTNDATTLVLTRRFDAPRQLVYDAFTQAEHIMHWFCPRDFVVLFVESDLRVGGAWRSGMRAPDGSEYIARGVYRELDPPHRLSFTHQWEANDLEPAAETVVTITLADVDGATDLSLEQVGLATAASRDSHRLGWGEALDNLARRLDAARPASDSEILITRVFNAPRQLLWEAFTQPKHIEAWFGPRGFSTRVEQYDFREGGAWRYIMIGPDGIEYPSEGVFQKIVPNEHFVTSDEFGEGFEVAGVTELPRGIVQAFVFESMGEGKSRVTIRIIHPNAEERAKHEAMGVEEGYASTLDCLAEHLAAMRERA